MKESQLDRRALPQFFAYDESADINAIGSADSGFRYYDGIPELYSSANGRKISRLDMNGYLQMLSRPRMFNQCGGYYTFDKKVSDAIGGYPLGAILKWRDTATGYIRTVRSVIANNTYDFVTTPDYIDDVHWAFVDLYLPGSMRPEIFPDWSNVEKGILKCSGQSYKVKRNSLFIIQSGPPLVRDTVDGKSAAFIWANVKHNSEERFYAASMIAYIPPVSSAYDMIGQSADFIDPDLESQANYTAFYSSSPVQLYMSEGDEVKVTANIELGFEYSVEYRSIPLMH